jgi:hypothetical protein
MVAAAAAALFYALSFSSPQAVFQPRGKSGEIWVGFIIRVTRRDPQYPPHHTELNA